VGVRKIVNIMDIGAKPKRKAQEVLWVIHHSWGVLDLQKVLHKYLQLTEVQDLQEQIGARGTINIVAVRL